jgi:hypothetical protein
LKDLQRAMTVRPSPNRPSRGAYSDLAITVLNACFAACALSPFTPALFLMSLATLSTALHAYRGQLLWPSLNTALLVVALIASEFPLRVLWQRPLLAAWFFVPTAIVTMALVVGAKRRRSI